MQFVHNNTKIIFVKLAKRKNGIMITKKMLVIGHYYIKFQVLKHILHSIYCSTSIRIWPIYIRRCAITQLFKPVTIKILAKHCSSYAVLQQPENFLKLQPFLFQFHLHPWTANPQPLLHSFSSLQWLKVRKSFNFAQV